MKLQLPLREMSLAEKLEVMEELWADLSREGSGYEAPKWHREVLEEREKMAAEGENPTEDWELVKQRIREQVS